MTHLRLRMLEELQRRNYAENTIRSYIGAAEDFALHFNTPPDQLGAPHLRQYHLYLIQERQLAPQTIVGQISALRFFYGKTLGRPLEELNLLNPKRAKQLPTVLGRQEMVRLLDATQNLFQYTLLRTLYATALRRSELCQLKVTDIDSPRMMIHVRGGKGQRDRDLPIDTGLLQTLRAYWCWLRPPDYLFPGGRYHTHTDRPINSKTVWSTLHAATLEAGITKKVSPHTLRHSRATHWHEAGADLPTIQRLLGHAHLGTTTLYVHLANPHLEDSPDATPLPNFDRFAEKESGS
jgi:integrase/recombinase XerD